LRCHALIGRSAVLSRIYLAAVRNLTWPGLRRRVINILSEVDWPAAALPPRLVRVGGSSELYLKPHSREFDIEVVLGGRLSYEPEVFAFLDKVAGSYDTVIEIGANVGIFTVYFSKRLTATNPDAQIFAFEPSAEAYRRLRENLALNAAGNVTTFNAAIGPKSGFAQFYEPRNHLTNGSLKMSFASYFDEDPISNWIVTLAGATLLELLAGTKRTLFKIDVEGFEAEVLGALEPIITQLRPDILIEVLPGFEDAINAAIDFTALGYRFYGLTTDGILAIDRLGAVAGRDCFLTTGNDAVVTAPHSDVTSS
jgi:FkbM family methyltransferase